MIVEPRLPARNRAMPVQMEITTRCNFKCFYCTGRTMPQGDMPFDVFAEILDQHIARYGIPFYVALQGEGEPTLHRDFFRMAEHVRAIGSQPYTITNGTYKHPERFVGLFNRLGVSIDTLDPARAEAIGRYNLPGVLNFIDALAPHLQIVIHNVYFDREVEKVATWCQQRGLEHLALPLQAKDDYRCRYPDIPLAQVEAGPFSCAWLQRPLIRYHTLDRVELPCCFIKDVSQYPGMDGMAAHQLAGTWPASCKGCSHGQAKTPSCSEGVSR